VSDNGGDDNGDKVGAGNDNSDNDGDYNGGNGDSDEMVVVH
jgi:hypothetical protein